MVHMDSLYIIDFNFGGRKGKDMMSVRSVCILLVEFLAKKVSTSTYTREIPGKLDFALYILMQKTIALDIRKNVFCFFFLFFCFLFFFMLIFQILRAIFFLSSTSLLIP